MNNRKSRELRRVFDLPRIPQTMNPAQRMAYRKLKKRYQRLPSARAKQLFMENVSLIKNTVAVSEV